jgi:hypothetical protein
MDWDDVDEILFNGTKEQIEKVRCVECGNAIKYEFDEEYSTFTIWCHNCRLRSKACKVHYKPNCAIFYGNKAIVGIPNDLFNDSDDW